MNGEIDMLNLWNRREETQGRKRMKRTFDGALEREKEIHRHFVEEALDLSNGTVVLWSGKYVMTDVAEMAADRVMRRDYDPYREQIEVDFLGQIVSVFILRKAHRISALAIYSPHPEMVYHVNQHVCGPKVDAAIRLAAGPGELSLALIERTTDGKSIK